MKRRDAQDLRISGRSPIIASPLENRNEYFSFSENALNSFTALYFIDFLHDKCSMLLSQYIELLTLKKYMSERLLVYLPWSHLKMCMLSLPEKGSLIIIMENKQL